MINIGGGEPQDIVKNAEDIAAHDHKSPLNLSFGFDTFRLDAEAGDFAKHESLGWSRDQATIALEIHNEQAVFEVPDTNATIYNIERPLTFQNIQDLHLYNGVFGGRIALHPDISIGGGGCFTSIETTQATNMARKHFSQMIFVEQMWPLDTMALMYF